MLRGTVKLTNKLINFLLSLVLLTAGAYAAYCLWDNSLVYAAAENVQAELLLLKPKASAEEDAEDLGPGFDELQAINPDVCAWVSMDGTKIDHVVLQGMSNLDYINRDVYGNFSLPGSIFLDTRNNRSFADPYSVLYGHHMENSAMFGDLDRYLEPDFFLMNTTGELLLPGRRIGLQVIASLQTVASDPNIFEPAKWKHGVQGLLDFAEEKGKFTHPDVIEELRERFKAGGTIRILALTTCASEFTDARTIVLTFMQEYHTEESGDKTT